jgi:multiple sugar transport system substrate-binding protein
MRLRAAFATAGGALILAAGLAGNANAEAVCAHDLRVLAQPRDGLTLLEKYKDEFKALSGASFDIDYLNENDRRAKSRADASTVGKYNVYYIDEANVALFAKSKWVAPLLDYYPKDTTSLISTPAGRRSRPLRTRFILRR